MGQKHQCVREISISCLSHASSWGSGPQPRHMPQLGTESVLFQFAGWCSTNLATLARASLLVLKEIP